MLTLDAMRAVMLGHAVADALGVPVEFCTREELALDPVVDMREGGTYPMPRGSWSDDTSMSLAALDVLAGGVADFDAVMENFVRWKWEDAFTPTGEMFDIGATCYAAIANYLATDGRPALSCGLDDERSNGNGSLMRIHPFVLFAHAKGLSLSDTLALVENGSRLTHAHPRAILGCKIYELMLTRLLLGEGKAGVLSALREAKWLFCGDGELAHYARLLSPDFAATPKAEIKSGGYVVDTLEAAVHCLLGTDHYADCVLTAVNLGEDTDTVAAVAGGLAGALYGYDAIPREWKEALLRRDYIEEMCARAVSCWCAP